MSIYKDLLFLHGYVRDPGLLADAPSPASAAGTPAASTPPAAFASADPAPPAWGDTGCLAGACG